MNEYKPIACALHETYQLAVIKDASLDLVWDDDMGRRRHGRGLAKDVYTQNKAEYLLAEFTNYGEVAIRLDRIHSAHWADTGNSLVG